MKKAEVYTKGIVAGETVKKRIKQAQKEAYNKALKDAAKSVKLTEFAYEFFQEGAYDAIDKDSILNLKIKQWN